MGRFQIVREFLLFLRQEKKWYLIPLLIVFLILTAAILLSESQALAPFLYPFL